IERQSIEIHRPIPRLYMGIGAPSTPHSYGQNRPKGQVHHLSPHVVHRRALNATSVLYVEYPRRSRDLPRGAGVRAFQIRQLELATGPLFSRQKTRATGASESPAGEEVLAFWI